jgi:hypothetical protein
MAMVAFEAEEEGAAPVGVAPVVVELGVELVADAGEEGAVELGGDVELADGAPAAVADVSPEKAVATSEEDRK